ncbi:MAG: putative secreted protein [Candidatus Phytoplasma cynodontis]|nr:MAG: putative secreted protein [Candidatus Phytoplasma cynodontis]
MLNKIQFIRRRFFAASVLLFFLLFIARNSIKAQQNFDIEKYTVKDNLMMHEMLLNKKDLLHELVWDFMKQIIKRNNFNEKILNQYHCYEKFFNLINKNVSDLTFSDHVPTLDQQKSIKSLLTMTDIMTSFGKFFLDHLYSLESFNQIKKNLEKEMQQSGYDENYNNRFLEMINKMTELYDIEEDYFNYFFNIIHDLSKDLKKTEKI